MTTTDSLLQAYGKHRFAVLFASLLLTLAGEPLLNTVGVEAELLQGFLVLNALAAVLGAMMGQGRRVVLALLGVFIVFRVVGGLLGVQFLLPVSDAMWAFIAILALVATLRAVLRRGPVDSERIFAALSVYVLAGLVFGVVYWSYEQIWPGSFGVSFGEPDLSLSRMIYFSFVTAASLGYGDIVPVNEAARGMAVLEVVSGQMYLAVLVARLVGLYSAQEHAARDRSK